MLTSKSSPRRRELPRPQTLVARRFLKIIIEQARHATRSKVNRGCLQVCTLTGDETAFGWQRFKFNESDTLIEHAMKMSELKRNIYIEGRTVKRDAQWRGKMHETCWVFALVIDSDGDKAKAWAGGVEASLIVETSPGNRQYWFFLQEAISAEEARAIGANMRAVTKTDSDSGVPTQPFRVAGFLNHPNSRKRARGRSVSPTHILAHRGRRWGIDELAAAFPAPPPPRKHKTLPVRRASPLSALTAVAICAAYAITGNLRHELLHGQPRGEDRNRAFWKFANKVFEAGVPAEDAFVLLRGSAWSRDRDDDVERVIEKIWGA